MIDLILLVLSSILTQLLLFSIDDRTSFDAVLSFGRLEWIEMALAFLAAGLLLYRRWQRPAPRRMQFIYFLFPMLLVAMTLISVFVFRLSPMPILLTFNIPLQVLLAIFVLALSTAVSEEALYRGVLLHHLAKFIWPTVAMIITVIIFCLFHRAINFSLFFVAMAFSVSYMVTGSLMGSICTHFLYDLTCFIYNYIKSHGNLDDVASGYLLVVYYIFLISLLLGLCIGMIVYALARRRQNKSNKIVQVSDATLDCAMS